MLRRALPLMLLLAAGPAAAGEKALPDAFQKVATGLWTRVASDLRDGPDRNALLRAIATCGSATARTSGTLMMPRNKLFVRADLATNVVTAIAAAKAGRKRGAATPWALATDRGYRAVAFVSRGRGAKARHFMLDDTGVYLRCGGLPKPLEEKARAPEEKVTAPEGAAPPEGG